MQKMIADKRELHTKRLARILQMVDKGRSPIAIKSVHVFGSYARGALEPNDLDLIVIHEAVPKTMLDKWQKFYEQEHYFEEHEAWRKASNRCMAD